MRGRDKNGAWHLSSKGYPRYHSGPYRNQYVHRVRMAQHLGRKLRKDEDVHHKSGNKLNYRISNLEVLDHHEHGCVSSKQRWFVYNIIEPRRKKEWDEYFDQAVEVPQHQQEDSSDDTSFSFGAQA